MKKALTGALVRALLFTAAFGLVALLYHPMGSMIQAPTPDTQAQFVAGLLKQHRCWTSGSGHPFPTHVVAFWHGSIVVGGKHLTGVALDSIFKHPVKGLTVFGFCR